MSGLPSGRRVAERAAAGAVVAGTLLALGEQPVADAAVVGALAATLWVATDVAEGVVGDYAGNAFLGLLALGFVGVVVARGPSLRAGPVLAGGLLVGGWLVVDGVQHLRYGVERDRGPHGHPRRSDVGLVRGLAGALADRLVEPFVLGRRVADGA